MQRRIRSRSSSLTMVLVLVLSSVLSVQTAFGRDPGPPPSRRPACWWLGACLGAGFVSSRGTESLVSAGLNLTLQWNRMFVSLRGFDAVNPTDDRTSVLDGGLLVGYFKRKARSAWSYGAGISYVDMYPPAKPPFTGIGFPLEVRYYGFLSRAFAWTAGAQVNLNGGGPYAGVAVGIQFGRVRS